MFTTLCWSTRGRGTGTIARVLPRELLYRGLRACDELWILSLPTQRTDKEDELSDQTKLNIHRDEIFSGSNNKKLTIT